MVPARRRLVGAAREFFEREVGGLFKWDRVAFDTPEPMPDDPETGRRSRLGKHREMVMMRFADFAIEVRSSEDKPPLGQIRLFMRDRAVVEGPLETTVWNKVGNFIKERHNG